MQLTVNRAFLIFALSALVAGLLALPGVTSAQTPGVVCPEQGDLTPEQSIELAQADPARDADNDGFGCDENIIGGQPTSTAQQYLAQQGGDETSGDDGVATPSLIEAGGGYCATHDDC